MAASNDFDRLPAELLTKIVEESVGVNIARISSITYHTISNSLCNFRLTCRALCTAATPILFRGVYFSLDNKSWTTITNIANSPHLARHVCRFVYEPAFFLPTFSTLNEFRHALLSTYSNDDVSHAPLFSDESFQQAFDYYRQKQEAQRLVLDPPMVHDDAQDLRVLLDVLPKMPNIKEIYWRNFPEDVPLDPANGDPRSRQLTPRVIDRCMSEVRGTDHNVLVAAIPMMIVPPEGMTMLDSEAGITTYAAGESTHNLGLVFDYHSLLTFRGMQLLVRVTELLKLEWTSLHVALREGFPRRLKHGVIPPQKIVIPPMGALLPFLNQLTAIGYDFYIRDRSDVSFLTSGINGTLLSIVCTQLTRISVKLRFQAVEHRPLTSTKRPSQSNWYTARRHPDMTWQVSPILLIGNAQFPHLQEIEIDGLVGSKEVFIRFLRLHQQTLRSVYISGFAHFFDAPEGQGSQPGTVSQHDRYIDDGNWAECRDLLRQMAELQLNLKELAIWPTIPLTESRLLRELVEDMQPDGLGWQDLDGSEPCYFSGYPQVREFIFGVGLDIDHMDLD